MSARPRTSRTRGMSGPLWTVSKYCFSSVSASAGSPGLEELRAENVSRFRVSGDGLTQLRIASSCLPAAMRYVARLRWARADGQRSTVVCHSVSPDWYSLLRRIVVHIRTTQRTPTVSATIASARRDSGIAVAAADWPASRALRANMPAVARTATAAIGKYIRRSSPTSVRIGTMLEAGASVMKNQAPRNPALDAQPTSRLPGCRSRR